MGGHVAVRGTPSGSASRTCPQLVTQVSAARRRRCCRPFSTCRASSIFPTGSLALPWDEKPRLRTASSLGSAGRREPGAARRVSAKSWLSHGGANRTAPILPLGRSRRGSAHLAGRRVGARICGISRQRSISDVARGDARAGAGAPGRAADGARVVRRGGARADAARRPQRRASSTSRCSKSRRRRSMPGSTRSATAGAGGSSVGDLDSRLRRRRRHDRLQPDRGGRAATASSTLERVAVGEHILLGGDNMDLALARLLQQRLESGGASRRQLAAAGPVAPGAASAKEALLGRSVDPRAAGHAARQGLEADRRHDHHDADAGRREAVLLEGFFPAVPAATRCRRGSGGSGCRRSGLPYAADPAVTRHLARFLRRQADLRPSARAPSAAGRAGWPVPRTCSSTAAS